MSNFIRSCDNPVSGGDLSGGLTQSVSQASVTSYAVAENLEYASTFGGEKSKDNLSQTNEFDIKPTVILAGCDCIGSAPTASPHSRSGAQSSKAHGSRLNPPKEVEMTTEASKVANNDDTKSVATNAVIGDVGFDSSTPNGLPGTVDLMYSSDGWSGVSAITLEAKANDGRSEASNGKGIDEIVKFVIDDGIGGLYPTVHTYELMFRRGIPLSTIQRTLWIGERTMCERFIEVFDEESGWIVILDGIDATRIVNVYNIDNSRYEFGWIPCDASSDDVAAYKTAKHHFALRYQHLEDKTKISEQILARLERELEDYRQLDRKRSEPDYHTDYSSDYQSKRVRLYSDSSSCYTPNSENGY